MAYTLIEHAAAGSVAGAEVTTPAINSAGATLLVPFIADYDADSTTPSDSKSNIFTPLTAGISVSGSVRGQIFYSANPIVGSGHTFTATPATLSYPAILAAAFSGALLVSPFDDENGAALTGTPGVSLAAGIITPIEDNELVLTCLSNSAAITLVGIDSGFTILDTVTYSDGNHIGGRLAYKILGAGTQGVNVNPTWTWTTACFATAVIASFKAAVVGGTASRANGVMQICLTAETSNNRVPIRYVTAEHGVPVETVGTMATGVVPCVESVDANAVPVVEVEAA